MPITFHQSPHKFPSKSILRKCLLETSSGHGCKIRSLNYIFVSDEELLIMNIEYLGHDYYTDIITFDNMEITGLIEGDIFISIDRIVENGAKFGNGTIEEFIRVIGHGLLHLLGFKDKDKREARIMRDAENAFIQSYYRIEKTGSI